MASEVSSIHNRGIRALANLAQDHRNCREMFDLELPAFVASQLMNSDEEECQSTYCRFFK